MQLIKIIFYQGVIQCIATIQINDKIASQFIIIILKIISKERALQAKNMYNNPQQLSFSLSKHKCCYCTLTQIRVQQISKQYQNLLLVKQQQLVASYHALSRLQKVFEEQQQQNQLLIATFKQTQNKNRDDLQQLNASIDYLKNRQKQLINRIGQLENQFFIVTNQDFKNTPAHTSRINSQKSLNVCNNNSAKNINLISCLNQNQKTNLSLINHSQLENIRNMKQQLLLFRDMDINIDEKQFYKKQNAKLIGEILNLKNQNDILRVKQRIALMRAMQFSVISLK